jgi:putative addiction module component (TIGR02574 family)
MSGLKIKNMSTTERLEAMEALWDSLLHEEKEIDSPVWHQELLKSRKKKIENGEAEFISIEKLKASRKK